MFPQASAFLVFDPMFAFGHGIHIKAKTERKTGTFTASEQCLLQAFVPFKVYNKSNFRGRLIHRNINKWDFLPPKIGVDLYTSSTYTPENTVSPGLPGFQ